MVRIQEEEPTCHFLRNSGTKLAKTTVGTRFKVIRKLYVRPCNGGSLKSAYGAELLPVGSTVVVTKVVDGCSPWIGPGDDATRKAFAKAGSTEFAISYSFMKLKKERGINLSDDKYIEEIIDDGLQGYLRDLVR